jgi:hypothetical protein
VVAIPIFIAALILSRRGSIRAQLVSRQASNDGYSFRNLVRASAVVNCQLTVDAC